MKNSVKNQKGFSLVEVLIAILLLSFAVLGTVGMLVNGLKLSNSANYRSVAAEQASSIAELLRSNPTALLPSAGYTTVGFSNVIGNQSEIQNCFTAIGCGGQSNFVQNAIGVWQEQLVATLGPTAVGIVCYGSNAGTDNSASCPTQNPNDPAAHFFVKVCWNEKQISVSNNNNAGAAASGANKLDANSNLCTWVVV